MRAGVGGVLVLYAVPGSDCCVRTYNRSTCFLVGKYLVLVFKTEVITAVLYSRSRVEPMVDEVTTLPLVI